MLACTPIFFFFLNLCMITHTTEVFTLIPVSITLTSVMVTVVPENENSPAHFLANFPNDMDQI